MTISEYNDIYENRKAEYAPLKEKHNPEGSPLREHQLNHVKVLERFNAFCKLNGISYYIGCGTLIGAVRHHGFVPWDDDADIWMMRQDYDKFRNLIPDNIIEDDIWVCDGIRPEIGCKKTLVCVDIFVLDIAPRNPLLRFIKTRWLEFCYAMVKCREKMQWKYMRHPKPYIVLAPIALFASKQQWKELREKSYKWLSDEKYTKGSKYLQCYNEVISSIRRLYPIDAQIWEPIELPFEGLKLVAPKGFENVLTIIYGDFMSLPNKLRTHGTIEGN